MSGGIERSVATRLCFARLCFAPSDVVVEDHLEILGRLEHSAHRVVARCGRVRVHVEDFAVSLVLEQQAVRVLCDYRVVCGRIRSRRVRLPVIETAHKKRIAEACKKQ